LTDELKAHRSLRTESPPPPSEDIHLPGPSYLPIVVAAGIAVSLVGLVLSWVAFALGMIVWLTAAAVWVRKAREEMAELPLDHG
jgi:type IV secretory pathway TrbD component